MKIAQIISCELDSTLRPTVEARIWYHSGLTAGIDIKRQLQEKGMLNVWLLGDYCAFYGRVRRAHPTRKFTFCGTPERPFKREWRSSVSNFGHGAVPFPYPKIIVAWGDRPPCAIAPDVTIARLIFGKRHGSVSWLWVILINSVATKFGRIDQKIGVIPDNSRITPITDFKL